MKSIASGDCVSLKTLAVSGHDFPDLRGPALGQLLNRLLEHVLQAPADNNRETLLELSKKFEIAISKSFFRRYNTSVLSAGRGDRL